MRTALLIAATYTLRSDLVRHPEADHDARAMRLKLSEPGFDFDVIDIPASHDLDEWMGRVFRDRRVAPDDPVIVYISGCSFLGEDGNLSIEVDHAIGPQDPEVKRRVPLTRVRSAMTNAGLRGSVLLLELVHGGPEDAVISSEHVAAARRVFAPALSGYTLLCAARAAQSTRKSAGPSAFTSLWLRALDKPELRNMAGAVVISRVIDSLRDDPDLYTDVSCFSLIAGKRDLVIYSHSSAGRSSIPPASQRLSSPPTSSRTPVRQSVPPSPTVSEILVEAEELYTSGDAHGASEAFKKALLLIGDEKSSRRADIYVRLAQMKAAQGRRHEAMISYRKSLAIIPSHLDALSGLADLARADGDFTEAARLRRALLADKQDRGERFVLLLSLADDCEKGRDIPGAIEALEGARSICPEEPSVLSRLTQVYETSKGYAKAVEIKILVAKLKGNPEDVARGLTETADYAMQHDDVKQALELYAFALDADPATPRAFDTIWSYLFKQGEYAALEQSMVQQIDRLKQAQASVLQAQVWRALADLRLEHLNNEAGAIVALDQAVALVPGDVEGRVALAALLAGQGRDQEGISLLEIAAWDAPGRVATYRGLYRLFAKTNDTDRAYLACAALSHLGDAEMDEQLVVDQYRPEGAVRPLRSLDETTWQLLYPPSHDTLVRRILQCVAPVAIAYKIDALRKQSLLPVLDPEARQDPRKSTVSLTRTFVWACKVLDAPLPEIYVADEVPGGIAAVPAQTPTAVVGRSVLARRTLGELAFLVGRDLTYYRPEHYILVLYSTLKDLTTLFLASVRAVRTGLRVPENTHREVSDLAKHFRARLGADELKNLEAAIDAFDGAGGRVDLMTWAKSIELAATRAGLLVCGDLDVATSIVRDEDRMLDSAPTADRLGDLLPFCVSAEHAKLREHLGIAVS